MPGYADPGFDTLALHAGAAPDPATGARAVPIHLTTSFVFDNADHAAALFNMERAGHVYSRISNPTNAVLEERIAALEGGVGSIATASGQAALHLAIATIAGAGSHIVASSALYGGSHNLLAYTLPRFGIETTFVKPGDIDGWRKSIRKTTRLLFGETLGNPGLDVLDIPTVSQIAHDKGLPLLVDSTFTTPVLMRPFEHGADLVYHSATKFLSGHGTVIGGVLVDGGRFDWQAASDKFARFPELTAPYAGFHDMVFAEESSVAAFLLRARREGLRDFGGCMSPHTAWLILQGVETLPLRMERHVANTRKVVEYLAAHAMIEHVGYPELDGHPSRALAAKLLPKGCGAVFSFDLKGSRGAGEGPASRSRGRAFIEALKIFSHLANVGDCRSLVIHPASTTHFRMDDAALAQAGIGPGTIRLSVREIAALQGPDAVVAKRAVDEHDAGQLGVEWLAAGVGVGGAALQLHLHVKPLSPPPSTRGRGHRMASPCSRSIGLEDPGDLIDLPGHGASDGPALESVDAMRDWVQALLAAAGVKRAAFVGHSMGSLVAMEAAAALGEQATQLVMIATAYPMKVSEALLKTAQADPERAIGMVTTFSHSTLAAKPSSPGPGAWLHGGSRALMRQTQARYAAASHNGNLFVTDFRACDRYGGGLHAAKRMRCPVRFVLGTKDLMTTPGSAGELARLLKADIVTVPAGHSLMGEAPDAVLDALTGFITT